MTRKTWTLAERLHAHALRAEGFGYTQIGRKLGRSRQSVESLLKRIDGEYTKLGKRCAHCDAAIRDTNTRGYCRRCVIRVLNQDPEFNRRRVEATRSSPKLVPGSPARLAAGRKSNATRMSNPAYRAWLVEHVRNNMQPLSCTPEAEAKRDRREQGRKTTEMRLAWCPNEYRAEYLSLIKSKGLKAVEARAIILEAIEADKRRNKPPELSPFEKQDLALARGAQLIANDLAPSLTNPANYGEQKWERLVG